MVHFAYQGFALIGAIWSTYYTVRLGATFVDVYQRWRDHDWEV